jgi:hypothetical protein
MFYRNVGKLLPSNTAAGTGISKPAMAYGSNLFLLIMKKKLDKP